MPSLTFVLPHWLYWIGLILFPLIAITMSRRLATRTRTGVTTLGVGYLILLTGGFVGLHRFYVRSWLGVVYVIPFFGIIHANTEGRAVRELVSRAKNALVGAEFKVEVFTKQLSAGRTEFEPIEGEWMTIDLPELVTLSTRDDAALVDAIVVSE